MEVRALNYIPGVEIDDELIWMTEEWYTTGQSVEFLKYVVSDISDSDEVTIVRGIRYVSDDNIDYIEYSEYPMGYLTDYSLYPTPLLGDEIIIPRTRVMDYEEDLLSYIGSEYKITSLKSGYGMRIEYDDPSYVFSYLRVYNRQGILERFDVKYEDGEEFQTQLYSINGRRYTSIPGYPTYLIIGFSLIGMLGILLTIKRKQKQF